MSRPAAYGALIALAPCLSIVLADDDVPPGAGRGEHEPSAAASQPAPQPPANNAMAALIAELRKHEAQFGNYSATIKTSQEFAPPKEGGRGDVSLGSSPVRAQTETNRQIVQGERFRFIGEDATVLASGNAAIGKRLAVCDGERTISIEEGNCATMRAGRHEPADMRPPHTWGIFHLHVTFPLSVYLDGTEALKTHPKVGRFPVERGSTSEFYKVEAELVGEEAVGGLDCTKVRVMRWYHTNSQPAIQILWLAKERNLHVAKCRTEFRRGQKEVPQSESRVTQWEELAAGTWVPTAVEVDDISPEAAERGEAGKPTQKLHVELAALNPAVPADTFDLPPIPPSLLKFAQDADGRLIDSPNHPVPLADRSETTTLEAILERLAHEEQKYDQLEVIGRERYQHLNRSELVSGGLTTSSETRLRSVLAGKRLYYEEERATLPADGPTTTSLHRQAHDGRVTRTFQRYATEDSDKPPQITGELWLEWPQDLRLALAHKLIVGSGRSRQSLAESLRSGRSAGSRYPIKVEYIGDEQVGELHCHKLRCELQRQKPPAVNSYFCIWLARDRNLLVVRRESHDPAWWSEKLPTGIAYADDLREIRPGLWFPFRTATFVLQKFGSDGLSRNRIALQWRRDLTVDRVTVEPSLNESLFTRIEVPEGTWISVRDEQGEYIGRFKQPQTGNIEITPEELLRLRHEANVSDDEAKRRKQALDALVGKPAPELPRAGWINSEPLSWKDLAGKIVVIDFWATWCGPCQADLADLARVHMAWRANGIKDRALIGIHTAGTETDAVAEAASEMKLSYPILIDSLPKDSSGSWGELFDGFAVKQLPLAMVVDGNGKIAAHGRLDEMLSEAAELAGQAKTEADRGE